MLDSITPTQFEEWITYRSKNQDPWDVLIETLKLGFAAMCQAHGAKVQPSDFDVVKTDQAIEPACIPDAISMILGPPTNGRSRPCHPTGSSDG